MLNSYYTIVLLLYFFNISTSQNISNSYQTFQKEKKKEIINNFIIDLNSSLIDFNDIIKESKNEEDYFVLNSQTYIIFPSNNQELSNIADLLTLYIKNYTGLEILVAPNVIRKTSNRNKNDFIQIVLDKSLKKNFQIEISKRKIKIVSNSNIGIKRAILIFKKILEINFKDKEAIYENIKFPLADIFNKEDHMNLRIIGVIIITIISIYFSLKLFKQK